MCRRRRNDSRDDLARRIGHELREARERAGISARGLAAASGVSSGTVAKVELGHACPGADTIEAIARGLGVSVHVRLA